MCFFSLGKVKKTPAKKEESSSDESSSEEEEGKPAANVARVKKGISNSQCLPLTFRWCGYSLVVYCQLKEDEFY